MEMNWLQSIIYGLISGISSVLPVSSQAHEAILQRLFGVNQQPLLQLFIHTAVFIALIVGCRGQIGRINRERKLMRVPKRRRKRQPDERVILDWCCFRTAFVPLIFLCVFQIYTRSLSGNINYIALFLIANGIILYLPQHLPHGNKDSLSVSRLDGVLFGISGALSIFPGISSLGAMTSVASIRGFDRQYALNLSLLLCIPVMVLVLIFDVCAVIAAPLAGITVLLVVQLVIAAALAFVGAHFAIMLMRFLAVKAGFSAFAYYSWGAAMFVFILYMLI